jgi:hypothetical protein
VTELAVLKQFCNYIIFGEKTTHSIFLRGSCTVVDNIIPVHQFGPFKSKNGSRRRRRGSFRDDEERMQL